MIQITWYSIILWRGISTHFWITLDDCHDLNGFIAFLISFSLIILKVHIRLEPRSYESGGIVLKVWYHPLKFNVKKWSHVKLEKFSLQMGANHIFLFELDFISFLFKWFAHKNLFHLSWYFITMTFACLFNFDILTA